MKLTVSALVLQKNIAPHRFFRAILGAKKRDCILGQTKIGGLSVTLKENEKIIWRGRPVQGLIRNPVHIGWGLALLAAGAALGLTGAWFISALVLVSAGSYLAFFHANVEKNRRADMYYALTTQRAILAYGQRALAYPILPSSRITIKKSRFDVVHFAKERRIGVQSGSNLRRVGFGHLENGDEVYNLLIDLQKKSSMPKQ